MRVFVTGASGFVGSAVTAELLGAGHEVLGLARSSEAAAKVTAMGATVHLGDLTDLASLARGVEAADAVIHCGFNHDFTKFLENCAIEDRAVRAIGAALAGTRKKLIVTSGQMAATEDQPPVMQHPRIVSENAAQHLREAGVNAVVIRLPPSVHGAGDHGFVPMLIGIARDKGFSAYTEEGANLWPAVHRLDAARLYRLVLERGDAPRYHAAAESGVPFRQIAAAIAAGLGLPVRSLMPTEAEAHFGWFYRFATLDAKASNDWTRAALGYQPQEAGLLADMAAHYFG